MPTAPDASILRVTEQVVRIGNYRIPLAKLTELGEVEAAEAREVLEQIEQLRRENPLQFYSPAGPTHEAFHEAIGRPVRVLQGGNRSGKTTTGIVDDLIQATPQELLPERLRAFKRWACPFYCRVMTPDLEYTMKPVIWKKLEDWIPKALLPAGKKTVLAAVDKKAMCLRLECGCRFDFLSYEQQLDKLGGTDLHRVHYDEEPPEDVREECLMRLLDYDGEELFSFTPLKGLSHTYRRIIKNSDDPRVFVGQIDSRENKHLSKTALDRMMEGGALGLSEVAIQRRILGDFTSEHGFVYPNVDDWLCEVPNARAVQDAEEIIAAIDPGFTVCGLVFIARLRGEAFVVFDAIELKARSAEHYGKAIRGVLGRWGIEDRGQITHAIDPNNARVRNLVTGESVEDELMRQGIYCERGSKDIQAGVSIVTRLGNQGKLQIARNLERLIEVLSEYPLEENEHGELQPAKNGEEHLADALRYGITIRAWPDADEAATKQPLYPVAANVASPPPRPGASEEYVGAMGPAA